MGFGGLDMIFINISQMTRENNEQKYFATTSSLAIDAN